MSSENKMGVMPINKLILSMSIPMMLSMLIQALYNIVDLSLIHISPWSPDPWMIQSRRSFHMGSP